MNRTEYMRELDALLHGISKEEREEAMQYYNDYFDDAGSENEEKVIEELGSPAKLAETIRAGINGNTDEAESYGEYGERGYQDRRFDSSEYPAGRDDYYKDSYSETYGESQSQNDRNPFPNGIGIMRKNYVSFDDDWDDDDELDDTENVVSEEAFSGVENLKLDIGASEVRIKTGTDDKIHVDDSGMKTENAVQKTLSHDGKTLEITTKMRSSFSFKNVRNAKGTLVIYLPRDYKFDQVDMEYGAVTAEIDGLNAKSLKIESGASGCTIKNADIEELDVETGAGSLDFYGTVEKEVDIDCGAGSVTLNLEGKVEDYNYELDSSAGSVEIGEDIDLGGLSTEKSINNGSKRTIEISNGAGSVEIRFH